MNTEYSLKSIHSKEPVIDFWCYPFQGSFILAGVKATFQLDLFCWGVRVVLVLILINLIPLSL